MKKKPTPRRAGKRKPKPLIMPAGPPPYPPPQLEQMRKRVQAAVDNIGEPVDRSAPPQPATPHTRIATDRDNQLMRELREVSETCDPYAPQTPYPQPATPAELSADAERVMLMGENEYHNPQNGLVPENSKPRDLLLLAACMVMGAFGAVLVHLAMPYFVEDTTQAVPVLHASQEPYKVPAERHPCSYYAPQGYVWDREAHACLKDGTP